MIWLISILILLAVVAVVLMIRTLSFKSRQVKVEAVENEVVPDEAVERLSKAISYKTISYYEPDEFDRGAFEGFHKHLKDSFPNVNQNLTKEVIDEFGLLYTWKGTNKNYKPILLMAHQDVVPIEEGTEEDWTCSPFSGEIKDGFIWGRGTMDIKCCILGTLEAVEALLKEGFIPSRTVYLAYGYDEEIKGERGAKAIAKILKDRGVSLEYILDEGGNIVEGAVPGVSKPVALIGNAEKGYLSLDLVVESAGGHSSMPPSETPVGILAQALARIDKKVFPARMDGVAREFFETCGPEMKFPLKVIMANYGFFKGLLKKILSGSATTNAAIRTTAVATMLQGSPVDNVLPQKVKAVVNLRIFPGETIDSVKKKLKEIIRDDRVKILQTGYWDASEPAAVSRVDSPGYISIERSVREVFPEALVAPFLMIGITDSRHYRELTENIYRFAPIVVNEEDLGRVHSTNERIGVDNYKDMIRFYIRLLRNSCR